MNKKQQRAAKLQRQQALVDAAKAENRALTAEEQAEFDSLQRDIDQLATEITAEDQQRQQPPAGGANPAAGTNPEGTPTQDDAQQRAITGERTRITTITAMCRDFNVDPEKYISDGSTVDQVRAAIMEQLRTSRGPLATGVHVTNTGEDEFRSDASDGLLIRGGVGPEKPTDGARQFAHMSLRDLSIECLEREGVTNARRMSNDDLFREVATRQFYNPTSAFPTILDQAIEKAYKEGHRQAPVTFDQWTTRGTLSDFKVHDNNYLAGPIGDFLEVPEGGELKSDKPVDAKLPTRRLKTYGKQFTLTRQAFINDDIGLVTRIPARHAAAARRTINRQCFDILLGDTTIYDGKKLFSTDHRNVLSKGTGFTAAGLQAMIMAISTQKDQFDQAIIIRPAKIVVPVGMDFQITAVLNSPTIQTTDNTQAVNPLYAYRDQLAVIADPEINAKCGGFGNVMPWFLMAAASDTAFIEVDYLNGQEVPTIRRMETPGQLGFVWDIWLDWGISVMDYRGAVKNPGVEIKDPLTID